MSKKIIVKRLIGIKELNSKKLDLIVGLTGKSLTDIVNDLIENKKTIDEVLEESKKNSNLL